MFKMEKDIAELTEKIKVLQEKRKETEKKKDEAKRQLLLAIVEERKAICLCGELWLIQGDLKKAEKKLQECLGMFRIDGYELDYEIAEYERVLELLRLVRKKLGKQ